MGGGEAASISRKSDLVGIQVDRVRVCLSCSVLANSKQTPHKMESTNYHHRPVQCLGYLFADRQLAHPRYLHSSVIISIVGLRVRYLI